MSKTEGILQCRQRRQQRPTISVRPWWTALALVLELHFTVYARKLVPGGEGVVNPFMPTLCFLMNVLWILFLLLCYQYYCYRNNMTNVFYHIIDIYSSCGKFCVTHYDQSLSLPLSLSLSLPSTLLSLSLSSSRNTALFLYDCSNIYRFTACPFLSE